MAKKVDQTKIERIRNASVEVISEHGILGGSVASIAERADVSVGYLYRHYPGKTELINDLLENALNAITDRIHALIRETDDIERIVGGIVGFLIESAADNPAKIKIEEVAEKGNQTRGLLVSELTERYYGLVLALQVVEVRRQVLEGMQHHLSDAKALEANGIIAKGERLYAEVHTAEAERELLKAQKTVETLYSALSNTLGGDESTYIPATSMFILNDIESVSYFKDLAKQHSPLLKQVGYKKQLATENMRLQRADFAPQVALTGMAAFYNYQVSPIIPKWAVGAGVSLKIFDGLNREYKFSAAKSQIGQVEAVGHQAESDILTLIDKLYNEMVTYSQQLPSVNASGRFAEEYLRIKEEAFKEGAAPSSDVVDARLNLAKIRIERLQAAYYYDMMLARLLEACGQSELFPDYGKRAAAMPIRYEHDF